MPDINFNLLGKEPKVCNTQAILPQNLNLHISEGVHSATPIIHPAFDPIPGNEFFNSTGSFPHYYSTPMTILNSLNYIMPTQSPIIVTQQMGRSGDYSNALNSIKSLQSTLMTEKNRREDFSKPFSAFSYLHAFQGN